MKQMIKTPHGQAGLTLIELMVALLLSLLLMVGVSTVFVANKSTYQLQESLARLQENGRFATFVLLRDIRGAGYWGCGTQKPRIVDTLDKTSEEYSGYVFQYGRAVDGFEAGDSSWTPTLDASIVDPVVGSDIISLRFSDGGGARVIQHNTPSADIKVVAGADLQINDIVMVSDCEDAAIFQVTNLQNVSAANTNVVHNIGTVATGPGNSTTNLEKRFTNAELVRIRARTYYIRNGANGPSLWRMDDGGTPQELVEGVEQMQILYGVDSNSDQSADAYSDAATIDGAGDWDNVVSVRINLLLRTLNDNVTPSPQTYIFNGASVTPTDNRLRHVFSTTIAIRNRVG